MYLRDDKSLRCRFISGKFSFISLRALELTWIQSPPPFCLLVLVRFIVLFYTLKYWRRKNPTNKSLRSYNLMQWVKSWRRSIRLADRSPHVRFDLIGSFLTLLIVYLLHLSVVRSLQYFISINIDVCSLITWKLQIRGLFASSDPFCQGRLQKNNLWISG